MSMLSRGTFAGAPALALVALLLGGCGKPAVIEPPPPPAVLAVAASASATVNPDAEGRPSPVMVRVYQLQDAAAFRKATLGELWGSEAAVLGPALLAQREFSLRPGDTARTTIELPPSVRHLGVAAAFRDFRGGTWRAIVDVPQPAAPGSTQALQVALDGNSVGARLEPVANAGAGK